MKDYKKLSPINPFSLVVVPCSLRRCLTILKVCNIKFQFILLFRKFYIFYFIYLFIIFLGDDAIETSLLPSLDSDTTLVQVNVFLGGHGNHSLYKENKTKTCIISSLPVSPKSKWDMIDHLVIKGFKVG